MTHPKSAHGSPLANDKSLTRNQACEEPRSELSWHGSLEMNHGSMGFLQTFAGSETMGALIYDARGAHYLELVCWETLVRDSSRRAEK